MRRSLWLLLPICILAGCDTLPGTETVVLPEKTVTLRFEFSTDGMTAGQAVDVTSTGTADLGPDLQRDGFTKGEVVSATVLGAELTRGTAGVSLAFLNEASLSVSANSVGRKKVASTSSLSDQKTIPLELANTGMTEYVTSPSFQGVLTLVPGSAVGGDDYTVQATIRLRIEVEGV